MDELIKFQQSVIETMNRENQKCLDLDNELNLDEEIKLATMYKSKLNQILKDISLVKNKSEKLKQRALKLQERKQKEALKAEHNKDKQKQLDNDLIPVVLAKNKLKRKEDSKKENQIKLENDNKDNETDVKKNLETSGNDVEE